MRRFDRSKVDDLEVLASSGFVLDKGQKERRSNCPACDGIDCFSFSMEKGIGQCMRCEIAGDAIALRREVTGETFVDVVDAIGAWTDSEDQGPTPPPRRPTRPEPVVERDDPDLQHKRDSAAAIWKRTVPLTGTIGETYLLGRGCMLPPIDGDLRFIERLALFNFDGPAMAGRITLATDASEMSGLHITWVEPDGFRRRERRYLGPKAGGVIRLWPDEAVTMGLAIAEGIETALVAAHAFTPMWACMDAGNVAAFPVLEGIESLTVFADRDESGTGQIAAAACADRWLDAGREARVFLSDVVGNDVADEVAA